MKLCRMLVLVALTVVSGMSVARAQFGAYGMVSAERVNGYTCTAPTGGCSASNGTERPYGGTVGAYYDFRSYGRVRVGADLRGTFLNANKSATSYSGGVDIVRHYAGLGGVRASFQTPYKALVPYAQISAGIGKTPDFSKINTQIQGFAGLDIALSSNVDFRAIEFGYGELLGSNSHNIQSIGLGIVFHSSREK